MKDKKIIFILFIFIILLSFIAVRQFNNFEELSNKISPPNFKIEIPKLEFYPKSEKTDEKQEFISKDGKIKITYPADWKETENLDVLNKEIMQEGEILFFAQKLDLEKTLSAFLIIQKINLEKEKKLEEIIDMLKAEEKEKGIDMEIIGEENKENEAILDLDYKKADKILFYSKEKIIIDRDKLYLIDVAAPEKDWPEIKDEAKEIIDSVQFAF